MSLIQSLKDARIDAMKTKQTPVKDVLGLVLSAIQTRQIDEEMLSDDIIIQMIKKEIKSVRETQQLYRDAGRDDEAVEEQEKIDALSHFLPQMLTEDQMRRLVEESGFELVGSNRGKIIGSLMREHRAVIDPTTLQKVLDDILD